MFGAAGAWLRANLAVAMFLVSLVSAAGGALINGTFRIADYDFRLIALESLVKPDRIATLEARVAANEANESDHRISVATQFSQANQHIGILESQMKFLGDLEQDALLGRTRKSR